MLVGRTPIDVESVLTLSPDYDLAVRCLEYIRVHFGTIVPGYGHLPVRLLAHCHHSPQNCYSALSIEGFADLTFDEIESFGPHIDAWIAAQSLAVIVAQAQALAAPTWAALRSSSDQPPNIPPA